MATFTAKAASVTVIVDGKEIDLGSAMVSMDYAPEPKPDPIQSVARGIIGKTFTVSGTCNLTPEGVAFFVGLGMRYHLRQLHQDLGRYTRWPCTN